ncbi:MAG: energy-coupling factor ABC transporter permease [Chloroflexi bacterium]|nr:energy-coupling factor ABC transporter permease [Chloroflexota bacterium]
MHLPDGFINLTTAATTCGISAAAVAISVRAANKKVGERHVPLMGVMAAFTFAAQMLNFPIIAGTSGHLLGATLLAILLGPRAGLLIMTCVLALQAFVFQDGGILALGANILNMGVIGGFSGYYVYRLFRSLAGNSNKSRLAGAFCGAWVSVVLAAVAVSLELAVSGTSPLQVALPAMAGIHLFIGAGEAIITVAVLSLVAAARRDLLELEKI